MGWPLPQSLQCSSTPSLVVNAPVRIALKVRARTPLSIRRRAGEAPCVYLVMRKMADASREKQGVKSLSVAA
jgi:hypothetical protein